MEELFLVCYEIRWTYSWPPLFKANFCVNPYDKTLSGFGKITQAINPSPDLKTSLHGQYAYMCVIPHNCKILITVTGYQIIKFPLFGGIGPVIPTNVELKIVVNENWKSGIANYDYIDSAGKKHEITSAPVKSVQCNTIFGE